MPDRNKPFDPEYYDDDNSLFENEFETEDVLDQDEVESLEEVEEAEEDDGWGEEKEDDGYGGHVEGIHNWDEWN
jgi:hypothetical protein